MLLPVLCSSSLSFDYGLITTASITVDKHKFCMKYCAFLDLIFSANEIVSIKTIDMLHFQSLLDFSLGLSNIAPFVHAWNSSQRRNSDLNKEKEPITGEIACQRKRYYCKIHGKSESIDIQKVDGLIRSGQNIAVGESICTRLLAKFKYSSKEGRIFPYPFT